MLRMLGAWLRGSRRPVPAGRPDLRPYRRRPAQDWYDDYVESRRWLNRETRAARRWHRDHPGEDHPEPAEERRARGLAQYERRVHATWGLIAHGAAALPFALNLLRSTDPEVRADAAGILAELTARQEVVDALLERLSSETDLESIDSIVLALGRTSDRRAVPALARVIRTHDDGDTRWTAVDSLQRIVGKRWTGDTRIASATAWLDANGY